MPVHINASGFCNVFHSIFQMDVILRGKNYEIRSSKRNGSIIAHKFLDVSKYGVNRDFISSGKPQNRRRFETRPECHRPACRFITSAISTVTVLPPHTDRQTDRQTSVTAQRIRTGHAPARTSVYSWATSSSSSRGGSVESTANKLLPVFVDTVLPALLQLAVLYALSPEWPPFTESTSGRK